MTAYCPDCAGIVQPDGPDGYYCPACHVPWLFTAVILDPDGDDDD